MVLEVSDITGCMDVRKNVAPFIRDVEGEFDRSGVEARDNGIEEFIDSFSCGRGDEYRFGV